LPLVLPALLSGRQLLSHWFKFGDFIELKKKILDNKIQIVADTKAVNECYSYTTAVNHENPNKWVRD
jgi:hypothetical protein